jgi:23S rRNA pseudouridine2605 synthase
MGNLHTGQSGVVRAVTMCSKTGEIPGMPSTIRQRQHGHKHIRLCRIGRACGQRRVTEDDSRDRGIVVASYLARCGIASRRACQRHVEAGEVVVNGMVVTALSQRVHPGTDSVTWRGRPVVLASHRYLMLNKPPGYVCSAADPHADQLAISLLPEGDARLFSVGRLDRDSEGLLLFTNDGDWAARLTHPRYGVEKIYEVTVAGRLTVSALQTLVSGIVDDGEQLRALEAALLRSGRGHAVVRLIISEGRKREIRRMMQHLGVTVTRLQRLAIGSLTLGDLVPGAWRELTPAQVSSLRGDGDGS